MIRKVYAVVSGDNLPDNADAPSTWEVQLPGHIMQLVLKEKLEEFLAGIKAVVQKDLRMKPSTDISTGMLMVWNGLGVEVVVFASKAVLWMRLVL
jgi:hypothetical protein